MSSLISTWMCCFDMAMRLHASCPALTTPMEHHCGALVNTDDDVFLKIPWDVDKKQPKIVFKEIKFLLPRLPAPAETQAVQVSAAISIIEQDKRGIMAIQMDDVFVTLESMEAAGGSGRHLSQELTSVTKVHFTCAECHTYPQKRPRGTGCWRRRRSGTRSGGLALRPRQHG